jgi:hydroxyacylglutathione hydrolase
MNGLYVKPLALGPMQNWVYLVGAEGSDEVCVIDPAWEVDAIAAAAEGDGKRIVAALVSHCHGDHINGLPELLQRFDIPVHAQAEEVAFSADLRNAAGSALRPASPGDEVQVGPLAIKLLHTPGHTPGSQCLLARGALLSGDTVFVNACGRCDLRGGDPEALHRSIQTVLKRLPGETLLYPGHDYGDVQVSSIARETERNPYFQVDALTEFVSYRMRPRK